MPTRPRLSALAALGRGVRRRLSGEDLALDSAGVTFYGGIAVVPLLLLTLAGTSLLVGDDQTRRLALVVAGLLPDQLGARTYSRAVIEAGTSLSFLQTLTCVFPATFYGEGLLRAFDRLAGSALDDEDEASGGVRGWRGRLLTLPVLGGAPVALLAVAAVAERLREGLGGGSGGDLLGLYVSFVVTWLCVSTLLLGAYALLGRRRTGARALLWGAFGTGSVVAGFLLGFVLFLSLDLPLGQPFGGFDTVGLLVAVAGWGFVLHALVLVGWVTTLRLEARGGHPLRPVVPAGVRRPSSPAGTARPGRS